MRPKDPTNVSRRAFAQVAAGAAVSIALTRSARAESSREQAAASPRRPVVRPRPTPAQLQWQRDEFAMFLHFGMNTFMNREWGDGTEDPKTFAPTRLNARQWARTAREAGARAMILTAKHHDGFCLWPTRTTKHSVASSAWRGGTGDVVREFVDAARAEKLRVGLYCSPWDQNCRLYGDGQPYNDFYIAQLTELFTQYGEIAEVWFDGANRPTPDGRRQAYDWPRIWGTVRRLQPNAVMFSDAGPDIRWIGNESGSAGDPNWSTVNPAIVTVPGMDSPEVTRALQHGDRDGTVWRPGETDVSIRHAWFWRPEQDTQVKDAKRLMEIWFASVGRNSKLLLNVPPNREGRIPVPDVQQLRAFRAARDRLLARERRGVAWQWASGPGVRTEGLAVLKRPLSLAVIRLGESIENGQQVARYRVEGDRGDGRWRVLSSGETIGYCKLDRLDAPVTVSRVRVIIEDVVDAVPSVNVRLFAAVT